MQSPSQTNVHPKSSDRTLVIMAKAPKPGMVKTRLADCLPPAAVLSLYRCLFNDTMALARSLGDIEVTVMCPASDVDDLTRLADDAVRVVAQTGQGLAAGLTSVFALFAGAGRQQRVIAFNSDSPHLPASVLKSAFKNLDTCDLVVGPTHDGGYYLVGAKASHPTLFEGDGMGTGSALELLLRRARMLDLSVAFTDPFYDIDVRADLVQLAAELEIAPARAPRTADWLIEWGHAIARQQTSATKL
jgi:uncharacterized protein